MSKVQKLLLSLIIIVGMVALSLAGWFIYQALSTQLASKSFAVLQPNVSTVKTSDTLEISIILKPKQNSFGMVSKINFPKDILELQSSPEGQNGFFVVADEVSTANQNGSFTISALSLSGFNKETIVAKIKFVTKKSASGVKVELIGVEQFTATSRISENNFIGTYEIK